MEGNLKIISYNCNSFNSKLLILETLLGKCDLLCLQETLIGEDNSFNYNKIDPKFISTYVPATRREDISVGGASGGLALFWRKSLKINFYPIEFSDRILGLKLVFNSVSYILLNVYCFCDYGDMESLMNYKNMMAELSNICSTEAFDEIIILGDLNADPSKGRFFRELKSFIDDHTLYLNDVNSLPATSYSYVSSTSVCSSSWIDHVAVSRPELTTNHNILYGYAVYDHMPIIFDLKIPFCPRLEDNPIKFPFCTHENIAWDKVTDYMKIEYREDLDNMSLELWDEVLSCNIPDCNNNDHICSLDFLYNSVSDIISLASEHFPVYKNHMCHRVIGWNSYCKDQYAITRKKFIAWHCQGCPRQGDIFEEMKNSRSEFKKAMNYCRKNEGEKI